MMYYILQRFISHTCQNDAELKIKRASFITIIFLIQTERGDDENGGDSGSSILFV